MKYGSWVDKPLTMEEFKSLNSFPITEDDLSVKPFTYPDTPTSRMYEYFFSGPFQVHSQFKFREGFSFMYPDSEE